MFSEKMSLQEILYVTESDTPALTVFGISGIKEPQTNSLNSDYLVCTDG